MQKLGLWLCIPLLILAIRCKSPMEQYSIPVKLSAEDEKELLNSLKQGEALFKIHCAGCHVKKIKHKKLIPNFTATMLGNYSKNMINSTPEHKNTISPKQLRPEDLNKIITFLTFRKKDPNAPNFNLNGEKH
ncbi:MAG: cytochrome c [Bacteroidia bacterium]|nr:cytochrome c [Bacteroidia bacterium]